jgi:ribosome-binding protein aMBF1 (putative translation factor)
MKSSVGVPLKKVLEKKMKDPAFRLHFNESKALSGLCSAVSHARQARGLTQAALAKACETTQSVIARLENGNNGRMPSLELLGRVAKALKLSLVVGFDHPKAA